LLQDDREFINAIKEARSWASGSYVRSCLSFDAMNSFKQGIRNNLTSISDQVVPQKNGLSFPRGKAH
ncbi:hypothetical protein PIB30_095739, partial [Stylosanthes scabra]|nr:hypothetical protein [Stylosanthes scabra]